MLHLQSAIEQYLKEKSDHAIMIEGPWGCGKTYYWKNIIVPFLESNYSKGKYRTTPIYVSLFGLDYEKCLKKIILTISTKVSNIDKKIPKNSVWSKAAQAVSGFVNNQNWFNAEDACLSLLSSIDNNLLICLDDIERSKLTPTEFFGLVNCLAEQHRLHVIALCNEHNASSDDAFSKKEYSKQKEKCFSFSYKFLGNEEVIINGIIDEIPDSSARQWILVNRSIIIDVFHRIDLHNYRIIKRVLNCFVSLVYPTWDTLELSSKVENTVFDAFIFILACFVELGMSGIDKNEFIQIQEYDQILRRKAIRAMSGNHVGDDNSDTKWIEKHFQRYYNCPPGYRYSGIHWFDSLFNFFNHGCFDQNALKLELEPFVDSTPEPERSVKVLSNGFLEMSDDKFDEIFRGAWQALKDGRIGNPNTYMRLLKSVLFFKENQIVNIPEREIHDEFKRNLRNACSNIDADFDFDLIFKHDLSEPFEKEIYNELCLEVTKKKKDCEITKITSLIKNITQDDTTFFIVINKPEFSGVSVLNDEHARLLSDVIQTASNAILSRFVDFVRLRYQPSNISHYLSSECNFLEVFLGVANQQLLEQSNSLRKGILNLLVKCLERSLSNACRNIDNS